MITEVQEVEQGDDTATTWLSYPDRDATIGYLTAEESNVTTAVPYHTNVIAAITGTVKTQATLVVGEGHAIYVDSEPVENDNALTLTPGLYIGIDAPSEPGLTGSLTVSGGSLTTINNFDTAMLAIRSKAALELGVEATGSTVARFSDVGRPRYTEDGDFYTVFFEHNVTRTVEPIEMESVADQASVPDPEWDEYLIELKKRYAAMSDTEWFKTAHSEKSLGDVTPVL